MSPAQFQSRIRKGDLPSVCLFLGSEAFERRRCREALIAAHLGAEEAAREDGLTQYDLSEAALADVVDDARALSLFAEKRVILAIGAEAALPRSSRAAEEDGEDEPGSAAAPDDLLRAYVKNPSPDVVLVFEATRFDLEGEDKKKCDRVRKYYAAVADVVEFPPFSADEARAELQATAKRLKVQIDPTAAAMLVEALAADVARIAVELEKLALYAGPERAITQEDIVALTPDARSSTIFALVEALGRRDRARALTTLDALCRENVYLPLALAFLSAQFRQALAAQAAGLRSAGQIQGFFSKAGVAMWGRRAEQVAQTAQKFSTAQLESGLKMIFEADRDLRSARPDDRVVMEQFVVKVTA